MVKSSLIISKKIEFAQEVYTFHFFLLCVMIISFGGQNMPKFLLGTLVTEVTVVGIVCGVFLALFVVAGIRQMLKDND